MVTSVSHLIIVGHTRCFIDNERNIGGLMGILRGNIVRYWSLHVFSFKTLYVNSVWFNCVIFRKCGPFKIYNFLSVVSQIIRYLIPSLVPVKLLSNLIYIITFMLYFKHFTSISLWIYLYILKFSAIVIFSSFQI